MGYYPLEEAVVVKVKESTRVSQLTGPQGADTADRVALSDGRYEPWRGEVSGSTKLLHDEARQRSSTVGFCR